LEQTGAVKLSKLQELACASEAVDAQLKSMSESPVGTKDSVNVLARGHGPKKNFGNRSHRAHMVTNSRVTMVVRLVL
jgi:hypothetical protein